jgi:hypothetical protein
MEVAMQRHKMVWIVAAISLMCTAVAFAQDDRAELDSLVDKWTTALTSEDTDSFLECYWDDAIRLNYNPNGTADPTEGVEAMRVVDQQGFDAIDYQSLNLVYDEPVRFFPQNANPTYVYPNSTYGYMDMFEFERRRGEYKIVRQYLLPHPAAE